MAELHSDSEPRSGFCRYVIAVFTSAVWLAGYVAIVGVVAYYCFRPVNDFVDRQEGVLYYVCAVIVGLGYLMIFSFGWSITQQIWQRFTGVPVEDGPGKKHGRHSGWHPEMEAEDAAQGEKGRCPKCGFNFDWDGMKCGHCGFSQSENPWRMAKSTED